MKKDTPTLSRRKMLQRGALAGAGLLVPWHLDLSQAFGGTKKKSVKPRTTSSSSIPLAPDPSPITPAQFFTAPLVAAIPVARPIARIPGIQSYYEITAKIGAFPFHIPLAGTLGATPTYGYSDSFGTYLGYLGPTIEVQKNERVTVKFFNNLPTGDLGPFGLQDPNFNPPAMVGMGGRMIVHNHGLNVPSRFDGGPERMIMPGESMTYEWPNIQDAAQLWYHDHGMMVTRLNAYVGLAALYFIRDEVEAKLKIPKGALEIPLVLQDKAFYRDTANTLQLWYPNPWVPESFGNTMMVNAQLWPYVEVEPRRYRFRMLNASQARFLHLRLSDNPTTWQVDPKWGTRVPNSILPFYQIGAEQGFMPNAVRTNDILLGNAERADVIVDFKGMQGRDIYLSNDAATPYNPMMPPLDPDSPDPNPVLVDPIPNSLNVMQMMKIHVKNTTTKDTTMVMVNGLKITNVNLPEIRKAKVHRQITLVEAPYDFNNTYTPPANFNKILLNNRPMDINIITEKPVNHTTEIWQFVNMTPDTHPMHMHLVHFYVLDRQKLALNPNFDPNNDPEWKKYQYGIDGGGNQIATTGVIAPKYLTGPKIGPDVNETGPKDTCKMNPGEVTRLIMTFDSFTGKYVYHCHILDHEEMDMMQYFEVLPAPGHKDSADGAPTEYALQQNYPNPFNPVTHIQFQTPEAGHVTLRVFNTIGQEVARLVDEQLPAGIHNAIFNGENLASGAYYYRVEAGTFSMLKKMMLVK